MKEKINWRLEWAFITNEYSTFISYNVPYMNTAYEEITYQPAITDMIKKNNYDIFVDVGAYIGYFSIIASHFCKEVIAYEAQPFFYGILLNNTKFMSNVKCKYCWISNLEDVSRLMHPLMMVNSYKGDVYNIPVVSLDTELLHLKDEKILIKMDIEGNELNALRGSSEILKHPNIHWFIDVHISEETTKLKMEDILSFFEDREVIQRDDMLEVRGELSS